MMKKSPFDDDDFRRARRWRIAESGSNAAHGWRWSAVCVVASGVGCSFGLATRENVITLCVDDGRKLNVLERAHVARCDDVVEALLVDRQVRRCVGHRSTLG